MINRRTFVAAISAGLSGISLAQERKSFPDHIVKIIAPAAPGAPIDILGRLIAKELTESWGQPVIVDNRPGAGGVLGTTVVANAPADGYTLLVNSTSHCSNGALSKTAKYNVDSDFADLFYIAGGPYIVVTRKGSFADMKSLILAAKKSPGMLSFSSAGLGGVTHLVAEIFLNQAQIKMLHVPYKGTSAAIVSVLTGETQAFFAPGGSVESLIQSGKLSGLAVTSAARYEGLPELPTVREIGYPDFVENGWVGLWTQKATPLDIQAKIYDDLERVFQKPSVIATLAELHTKHLPMTREQFGDLVKRQTAAYRAIGKAANISVE